MQINEIEGHGMGVRVTILGIFTEEDLNDRKCPTMQKYGRKQIIPCKEGQ